MVAPPFRVLSLAALALASILGAYAQSPASAPTLEAGFAHPPESTKPYCYWYWISDNLSKEGITKDLESMAKVGIGEAYIGNVDVDPRERGAVKVLSEAWWGMVEHAVREGKRLGVKIGLFNCPGWSQSGGPWVKATQTMRYVTASETHVHGPSTFSARLAKPTEAFQDIATVAFPTPRNDDDCLAQRHPRVTPGMEALFDGDLGTRSDVPGGRVVILDANTNEPFTARSLTLHAAGVPVDLTCELQAMDDTGRFTTVRTVVLDRHRPDANAGPMTYGPAAVAFPAVTSRHFRFVIRGGGALGEIELSGKARLEAYVEKQLGKMFQNPHPAWDTYLWPTQAEPDAPGLAIRKDGIVNLTAKVAPDGTLKWNVPPGDWTILRSGMAPTGAQNAPASPEGTGYEIDKMSRSLIDYHFDQFVGKLLSRMPAADRTALRHVVADSYEQGSENWTDGFAADFKKRYGYDPIPYFPVFTGRLVGSADASERFLWDLRRLVADRISTDYVGGLRDVSKRHGLDLWLENYGHWGFAGEFMQYGGQSSEVAGEFWTGGDLGDIELRDASSAAHVYGKPVVHAEAWTSGGPLWTLDPWALKKRGDWAATEGINHFVFHVYIHQPSERTPGTSAWFGTEFNRHNTWFSQAGDWIDSIRRDHFMLQQGRYVADVAYFIGEDAPKMTGVRNPALPPGYSFDWIGAEAIEKRLAVKNGRFVLPDGMSYKVLVLPPQTTMRPELLRKIHSLVAAGGTVVGTPPERSPSLEGYPACDEEVRRLARDLWSGSTRGKGHVYRSAELAKILKEADVSPDVSGLPSESAPWIHRRTADTDVYFVSNQTDGTLSVDPSFRVVGRQPELWDAVTGERRDLPEFRIEKGRTSVPLEFAPRQSMLLVFRKPVQANGEGVNFPALSLLGELEGSWNVAFDPKWGGPASIEFERLVDWRERPEEGIRHYGGTATYRKTFDAPSAILGRHVFLDLGVAHSMARVRLNGRDLGLVWCAPWRVDVTDALREKGNRLEIEVVNTWANRIIGDQALPAEKRFTSETNPAFGPDSPLLPAGLVGPVRLLSRPMP